jgi:hypothetical protein
MVQPRRNRVSHVAVATLLFLLVAFDSPPTTSSIPTDRPAPPTAEEIATLAELSEWVLGGSSAPRFQAFSERTLGSESEASPMGFELFRRYHGREASFDMVSRMPYGRLIVQSARRYDIDPLLILSRVEAESSFDPNAVSVVGAVGLMQVLPTTAAIYSDSDPFDPAVNIDAGTRYLRALMTQFARDLALALAAYNAGPGNVLRHQGVPPFSETRRYVDRVMARYVDYHQQIWQESPDRDWFL